MGPSIVMGAVVNAYLVDDAIGLVNAIVAAQNFSNFSSANIVIRRNITFSILYTLSQSSPPQLPIMIDLNISAADGSNHIIIDWNLVNWVFAIYENSNATMRFTKLFMMNLSPIRSLIVPYMGYLPLFAVPFWVVW